MDNAHQVPSHLHTHSVTLPLRYPRHACTYPSNPHTCVYAAALCCLALPTLCSGMHENVLSLRYMDVGLQRTAAIMANMGDADRLMRAAHRGADFSLYKYIPSSLVAISALVAGHERWVPC